MRYLVTALAASLTLVLLPSVAAAATFCVHDPEGCSGTDAPNLQAAIDASVLNGASRDEIRVGIGLFADGPVVNPAGFPVDIIGVASNKTAITTNSTTNGLTIVAIDEPSTVIKNIRVHHKTAAEPATGLKLAGTAEDVFVTNQGLNGPFTGFELVGPDALLDDAAADLVYPDDKQSRAVFVASGADATIRDSYLSAAVGVSAFGDADVVRSRIRATQGVVASSGSETTVLHSQIQVPGTMANNFQRAALAVAGNSTTTLTARNVTAYSDGTGFGVWVVPNNGAGNNSAADVENSVFHNFQVAMRASEGGGASAKLDIHWSAYDLGSTSFTGAVEFNQADNVDLVPLDPGFVVGNNPRELRHDSPLVDAANPGYNPLFAFDVLGRPRKVGTVDIGAAEYQKRAPTAAAQAAPASAQTGVPVSFTSTGSEDLDAGDTLTYAWSFDDGGSATGPTATYAFSTPGTHTATLTVTDPIGKTATDTVSVDVTAAPEPSNAGNGGGGGPGGNGGPGGPGGAPGPAALSLTNLTLKPATFRTTRRRGSRKRPGTTVAYGLSRAATVAITVQQRTRGRWKTIAGAVVRQGRAGANSFRWQGKLGGKRLKPGRYRLAATARSADGAEAQTVRRSFRVVR